MKPKYLPFPPLRRMPHYVTSATTEVLTRKGRIPCRIDKFKQLNGIKLCWFNVRRTDTNRLLGRILKFSDTKIVAEAYDPTCMEGFRTKANKQFKSLQKAYDFVNANSLL